MPDTLPKKYLRNRQESDVFNASTAWDLDDVVKWNERYGMKMGENALALFGEYLETGNYVIFQSLVEHPKVPDFARFAACSVVFQRGDIYFSNGRQDLFLRSYFHSAKDENEFTNFGPQGGLHISFATDTLWYPLRVTRLNSEPTTVVLNLFTPEDLPDDQLPKGFDLQRKGQLRSGFTRFAASRVSATFDAGQDVPDVALAM